MARIDRVRENYEQITEKLFSDKEMFADYLKFAGKFYKLPSAQSMAIYGVNPNATMVADYDTWQNFGRQVQRGTTSIAVFNNAGGLKHLFDISQTAGAKTPYQWKLDKDIAAELLDEINEDEGQRFQSLSGCINYLGAEKAREDMSGVIKSLNISDDDRAAFERSFISMTQYFIAARCELGSGFKYNGNVDLSALDMLHSKAEKEKLCECVQLSGKSVLLSLERSINNIVLQGRNYNGRDQADMVRGGQEVLPRVQGTERQNVQTRSDNVRVSGANGVGADGRGTGSDEREYRNVRGEVAEVYDGELSGSDTLSARSAEMGADTQTDRQGSVGISGTSEETVREREPAPENVLGDSAVGEHSGNDSRQGDNGGHSTAISGSISEGEKNPEYDTSNNDRAEEHSPAFSLSPEQKYISAKVEKFLGHEIDKALFDKIYSGVYAYAYENKTPIQSIPDDELNDVILERTGVVNKPEIPADLDKIYVDRENEIVRMVYYNPDSTAGGQLVYNEFDFDNIAAALATNDPMDYLYEHCKQTLLDVDMEGFDEAARDYIADTEDFNSRDEHYLDKLFALAEPTYSIFRLKGGGDTRDYRFAGLSELRERGLHVDRENYNKVYSGRLKAEETLDDIYDKFNANRPDDFKGHSLSVGDIIEIRQNGKLTANYVDDFGFEEIPDFYLSLEERRANRTASRNETEIFKAKTAENFVPINGLTPSDIENDVRGYIQSVLDDNEIDAQIVDLAIVGSRSRNLNDDNSDLDVAVEFTSELKEDALFNILHEQPFEISGATVDINPIRAEETGTLGEYLKNAEKTIYENRERKLAENIELDKNIQESTIQFALLGNGVTVYDTSKTDEQTNDYPIIAHISAEGVINYRVDKDTLSADDIRHIENQAATVKQDFIERWNRLSVGTRYGRIVDAANALSGQKWDIFFADKTALTMDEAVKKYEHSLIFGDEDFPDAKRSVTAYKVGDFYELFNEDAQAAADLMSLVQTTRRGVPMVGFPAHVLDNYKRNFAMNGYYLKIGDERDIERIFAEGKEKIESQKSVDDLKVGDLLRNSEGLWRIKKIDGDFSVSIENTDKTSNLAEQSIIGHWKNRIFDQGFVYVSPAELSVEQLREIEQSATRKQTASQTAKKPTNEYEGEQLNLFGEPAHEVDIPERTYLGGVDIEQALTHDIISHGTMFRDGKFRIEEYYHEHKGETKDFAKMIAKEYGIGGHSVGGFDSKIRSVNYGNKGLEIIIRLDNGENTKAHWNWNKIADRIATLIDNGEYITERDIDQRIKNAEYDYKHNEAGTDEYERAAKILDNYGLLPDTAPEQAVTVHAEELEKGDKILLDGEEWTVRSVGDTFISLTNSEGVEQNYYNALSDKWYDMLNSRDLKLISDHDEPMIENDEIAELERAKELINDFPDSEYEDTADFSDLTRVDLAYTEDEVTQLPINIFADLENKRIISQFNNVTVRVDEYASLKEMNDLALSGLNFDELIHDAVSAEEVERIRAADKPIKTEDKPVKLKSIEIDLTSGQVRTYEETVNPIEIKNLAQLKRIMTVGTEFEITSEIRPEIVNQLRQVKYADTTGIYSIRPDAPDDKITLANNGRGSYLEWGKAADWGFKNGIATVYNSGMEHTPENEIFSVRVKPRVLEKQQTEVPTKNEKPMQREIRAVDLAHSMGIDVVDMSGDDKALTTEKNEQKTQQSIAGLPDNPIIERLSNVFSPETAKRLYNAFENSRMADWNSNQAKINRIKKAMYDILGNEEQTERAFSIISSAFQKAKDFTITDEHLGEGGAKAKFAANVTAIQTLKQIEREARIATPEEQETLSKYVGWGGIPQAFDNNNSQWTKEYGQLKELLTDDEYRAANASVLNAHYTTPTVIRAIYNGLHNLGFEGGNILEPAMGVGNFFGAMPSDMRKNSNLSGVELDSITGRIAKQLYPNVDIQVTGFEKTNFSDNFFDVVVGNVPFGNYPISDKRYNRENFYIHDYFIAKSLDKVAPGGIVAVVTTKGTLDKENPKVREYLARRADLVGAIRLPNNAFKANAGTEVTTDILFLQKREKMAVELPDWCYVGNTNDGVPVNNYFVNHPEMILGTMKQGIEFSMYGNEKETACVPIEGAVLSEQLEKAVGNLKINNAIRVHREQVERQAGVIPATADVRNFTFAEVDGKMYFRENNIMTEVTEKDGKPIKGKALERLKALNDLRKTFRELLTAQENDCSDEQLRQYQSALNAKYDDFVKKFDYISAPVNYTAFQKDDDYNSLTALEVVNEETKEITKSDIFSRRTIKHYAEITHVDTPQEAMYVAIDTIGRPDIEYMAKLCGKEPNEVIDALKADNLIYFDPDKKNEERPLEGWVETSEYLSGNVRVKLKDAETAAKDNPEFQRNVEALTAVIPKRIEAGDISARIGVNWVDLDDYKKFFENYTGSRFQQEFRRTISGEYKITNKGWFNTAATNQIYGTSRLNAFEIFENLLNCRDVIVRDKKIDPTTGKDIYIINKKETELAQDKANKMKDAFARWLWADPERREKYVTKYNELFNSIVGRKYDGSHQTFPGMSPFIKLKPHQLDAIARAKFGGNTLLAHCVGAGKSFEMIAATMEKKRLGLINKACVVVPKSLVGQMAAEWLRLYPQAKILTATEKDFTKDRRQKFIGRCCTGEYDAVIMSYEQFEKTSMSFEYRRDFIQREIDSLAEGIAQLKTNYRTEQENRGSIKDIERVKKSLETKLEKLINDNGKIKDTSLSFEQLGFDSIVVDEAHNYKNGLVVTKMNRVAGVQTTPAQKSEDILMKTQYLNENYGERNIIFATGTPVSNSMVELYVMQRYLRPSLLAEAGLQTFDDWANTFGEVVSKAELKPAGNGYRTKKRFAKFNNLPELMAMYKEFADIRTADMLDLPVPEVKGGKPETIVATTNDFQKAYMQVLAERSEQVHNGSVDAKDDNMLVITGEARLLGLDARCLNPDAENYPDSKVNLCIDKIMEIYTRTTAQKGVQAIFCDIAVSGDNEQGEQADKQKNEVIKSDEVGKFSVYNYIKAELIRRGIPKDEICFAGDANNQKQQDEMRAQLRSGTKRIVIASTSKLGTGANIQNKLVALHNLDIPWKPSDLEQRVGRIVRQGNENDEVELYNYVTKDTFDAYMMNIIVTKQKFISQLMSGDTSARSCEDVDEMVLNYTEMQALATGDPRIKEKIELDTDVARLKMLESEHYNEQYRLDDVITQAKVGIENYEHNIVAAKNDVAYAGKNVLPKDTFSIEIGGKVYSERKAAGEVLRQAAVKFMANNNGTLYMPIGNFRGFELALQKSHGYFATTTINIAVRHGITYDTEMDITGDIGNVARLENLVNDGIGKKLAYMEERLEQLKNDLTAALESKGKPFEHAEELETKSKRLTQLNLELEVGRTDEVIMNENEDEGRDNEKPERGEHDNDLGKPKPPSHNRH